MPNESHLRWLAMALAVLAWMLMAHPYEGVWHDATLYFGQTLVNAGVDALRRDVFFVGGSQDRYSIYAHLMGPLYEHLGWMTAHVFVVLSSGLAMTVALFALLRRFDPARPLVLWGLLAFAVLSSIYGGTHVIGYAEPFVTARSFAEPLLVWSLVALLAGRWRVTLTLQALAALFHPLMTLPVIAISWCYFVERDRRWLWLLAALPIAILIGIAGIPPWDSLMKTYDPYWLALVETNNRMVLLGYWTLDDQLRVVLDIVALLAVARLRPADDWTRLIFAVIVATLALFGVTALGADGFHSVLLTQLQLWRVHWILHLLVMALSPWLVAKLWGRGGLWPVSACALALALLNSHIGTEHGLATLGLWAMTSLAAWRIPHASQATVWLACGCIMICLLGLSAEQLVGMLRQIGWEIAKVDWGDRFVTFAAFPTVAVLGFGGLMLLARWGRAGALTALGASGVLLCTSIMNWDQRKDLARALESAPPSSHPFIAQLPASATVYWPNQLLSVWGMLERASHYGAQQGAGLLFNRDTAVLFGARKEMYRQIDADYGRCRAGAALTRSLAARLLCEIPATERLTALCEQFDGPDFLVLPGRLQAEPLAIWQLPVHRDPPRTFALYACSQLKLKEP